MTEGELADLLGLSAGAAQAGFTVLLRVGGALALLPVLGEGSVPARVRLVLALALSAAVAPAVAGRMGAPPDGPVALALLALTEAATGLALGLALRLPVMALQTAAAVAMQATSLAQMFGGAPGAEPSPAAGQLLLAAALALATLMGLHVRVAALLIASYDAVPPGAVPDPSLLLEVGLAGLARVTALGVSLAAPFVGAALLVNLALGFMGRAMPQLMLAFIAAPAMAGGTLLLLLAAAPLLLDAWARAMEAALAAPFAVP